MVVIDPDQGPTCSRPLFVAMVWGPCRDLLLYKIDHPSDIALATNGSTVDPRRFAAFMMPKA